MRATSRALFVCPVAPNGHGPDNGRRGPDVGRRGAAAAAAAAAAAGNDDDDDDDDHVAGTPDD